MTVVDLTTRKPVDQGAPKGPALIEALKRLIERVEGDPTNIESFYLIADNFSADNGLTAEQAITMLEREKFRILCMLDGVKAS